jgi:hypothetical protein
MNERPFRITSGYLVAVGLIFTVTACSWLFLGKVTDNRTEERDTTLRNEVGRLWGGVHNHLPPTVELLAGPAQEAGAASQPASQPVAAVQPKRTRGGKPAAKAAPAPEVKPPPPPPVPEACKPALTLEALQTDAKAQLALEHRRKGLLWYSTYTVVFDGTYTLENATPCAREMRLSVPFSARGASYDEFSVHLDGKELPVQISTQNQQVSAAQGKGVFAAGSRHTLRLRYTSRGMDRWAYSFGAQTARARNFKLVVRTDFDKVDFPAGSLSPTSKHSTAGGQELTWQFGNLLSEAGIAVAMPQRINPGPLASQISKFAPVSLAFFFFLLLLISVLRQVRLHPVHYAMLAAAFFSFHLLLVYLVDLIPLPYAFAICSTVSVALVVSYLRLAIGSRFALLWAGGLQALYLVLFSLAFFLEGYTGITITIFSVLTLFVVMQLTGRIDWAAKFAPPERPGRVGPTFTRTPAPGAPAATPTQDAASPAATAPAAALASDSGVFSRVG